MRRNFWSQQHKTIFKAMGHKEVTLRENSDKEVKDPYNQKISFQAFRNSAVNIHIYLYIYTYIIYMFFFLTTLFLYLDFSFGNLFSSFSSEIEERLSRKEDPGLGTLFLFLARNCNQAPNHSKVN